MTFNAEQLDAIHSLARQILCIAGAGSGKTSTLVARIQHMIANGTDPGTIVAISYTVAAANVLQSRLGVRLGYCGTLHSFMLRLLQKHGAIIGITGQLSILDDDGRQRLIESIILQRKVTATREEITAAMANEQYTKAQPVGSLRDKLALAAVEYHNRIRANNLVDFDTILRLGLRLVNNMDAESFPVKHLLVDEIQDAADMDMAIYLNIPVETRFFVGDDCQAVYAFRGGNVNGMLQLTKNPDWQVLTLQTNYRCRSVICDMANTLIEHNSNRYPKYTLAAKEGGIGELQPCDAPNEENVFIVSRVTKLFHVEQNEKSSIAILCRNNPLADEIRSFLKGSGLPVNERKAPTLPPDWKLAKLYLAFTSAPENDFTALSYLEASKGPAEADHVRRQAAMECKSINEFYYQYSSIGDVVTAFSSQGFSPEARELVHTAARRLSGLGEWSISDLLIELNRSGEIETEQRGGVDVMTCHSAKGKEWKHVIVAGCENEFWLGKDDGEDEISEARRLLYVAMTRGEDTLTLTYCRTRPQYRGAQVPVGPVESRTPLRFLEEI